MKSVFPYDVLSGDVRMQVDGAFVDNVPIPFTRISDSDGVVALDDLGETNRGWKEVRLKVTVKTDEVQLREGKWAQPTCFAVVRNQPAHVFQAFPLRSDKVGTWTGEVELRREEHLGRSRIDARVVATVDGVAGRLIGETSSFWEVNFEATRPTRERSVRMRWLDFSDPSNSYLKEYRDDPWLIDSESGEPVLYLNSGVDGFRGVLENPSGLEQKLVREILSSQVAAEAWNAMFNAAVYLCDVVDGEPEWPGGWHEDILRRMIPDLYPELPPDEALVELVEARKSGENGGDLQRRVMHGAGVRSRKPRKISVVLRDLRRSADKKETA